MVSEVARRAKFFCNLFITSPGEAFIFTKAIVESYPESEEFVERATALEITDVSFVMALEVMKIAPTVCD